MRIRADLVAQALTDVGYHPSEPDGPDSAPGYRSVQVGPRAVHLFHDGPDEEGQLALYTAALRDTGYHVQADRPLGTRHRLIVTRP